MKVWIALNNFVENRRLYKIFLKNVGVKNIYPRVQLWRILRSMIECGRRRAGNAWQVTCLATKSMLPKSQWKGSWGRLACVRIKQHRHQKYQATQRSRISKESVLDSIVRHGKSAGIPTECHVQYNMNCRSKRRQGLECVTQHTSNSFKLYM